jgi:hypothetical protein
MNRIDIFGNFEHAIWQLLSDELILKSMQLSKRTRKIFMLIRACEMQNQIYFYNPLFHKKILK